MNENQIEIYQNKEGIILNVQLSNETVWLNQEQLTLLFERDQSVISRHLANVFKEGELDKKSNMQKMHIANSDKPVWFYNLDVIISVGYRVKSIRGTQFRQWATKRLKDYLIEGVAINEKRLEQKNKEIQVLHDGIRILSRAIEEKAIAEDYTWLNQFSIGLQLLDDYDHEAYSSCMLSFVSRKKRYAIQLRWTNDYKQRSSSKSNPIRGIEQSRRNGDCPKIID